jgi:integrase
VKRDGLTEEQSAPLWDCLYLNTGELDEVLTFVSEHASYEFLYPMCVLAAYSGARRSELSRIQVSDCDWEAGCLTIRERKRSRSKRTTRSVPLAQPVKEVLSRWLRTKPASPFLFPEDHRCVRRRKTKELVGAVTPDEASHHLETTLSCSQWSVIPGWHLFRHSFISNCVSKGVDQRFIDQWVGHQTDEQRRRYRHLFPESQQQAIDLVFQ